MANGFNTSNFETLHRDNLAPNQKLLTSLIRIRLIQRNENEL